jgi:hypothetical protein
LSGANLKILKILKILERDIMKPKENNLKKIKIIWQSIEHQKKSLYD